MLSEAEPNIFPGNWDVITERLQKTYRAWFTSQAQWDPYSLEWEELSYSNFDLDQAVAQAYCLAKLALFEKSGIGAFGLAAIRASELNLEQTIPKFLVSTCFDECRHDEYCRLACNRLCPGFPYRFKPKRKLHEMALKNIRSLYENAKRYWRAFRHALYKKYDIGLVFSGFYFAEIGAQTIFNLISNHSRLNVYKEGFRYFVSDESRHLAGDYELLANFLRKNPDASIWVARQFRHGFVYLSPLLFKVVPGFWKLPDGFEEYDEKLESLAYESGLGFPDTDTKREAWAKAVEHHKAGLESIGAKVPVLPEIGVDGIKIEDGKDRVTGTPL